MALISICAETISAAPTLSENVNVKFADAPPPEFGDTETAAGGSPSSPNAATLPGLLFTPSIDATYTLPFTMVGKTNLFPFPN